MVKDRMYVIQPADVLEILLGKYFYEIVFESDSNSEKPIENVSVHPTVAVTELKDSNGNVWESVDNGKLLIFTPNNVRASNKVSTVFSFHQVNFNPNV